MSEGFGRIERWLLWTIGTAPMSFDEILVGGPFSLRGPPVTELPHRPKIHENTLILTRHALKQLFEFNTIV